MAKTTTTEVRCGCVVPLIEVAVWLGCVVEWVEERAGADGLELRLHWTGGKGLAPGDAGALVAAVERERVEHREQWVAWQAAQEEERRRRREEEQRKRAEERARAEEEGRREAEAFFAAQVAREESRTPAPAGVPFEEWQRQRQRKRAVS